MKKQLIISLLLTVTANCLVFSQEPDIIWQQTAGGLKDDDLVRVRHTPDGGAILGGYSISGAGFDKTENIIGGDLSTVDYWVVKLNNSGAIQWQNTIGGKSDDFLTCIEPTSDGGYIVGGYSNSNSGGDKTEPHFIGGTYQYDYWVIKLNSTGGIVWQNTIGGTGDDYLKDIAQTSDGGYILGGYSYSNASGDKGEPSKGSADFWVVKLNSSGSIVWQNTIGGDETDYMESIEPTSDGGYILGGETWSSISDDITENILDGPDFLVMKINSTGNIVWQNTIWGEGIDYLYDAKEIPATGEFIIAGKSDSEPSGDKIEDISTVNYADYDFWVLKLNSSGVIIAQNTIGGEEDDVPAEIEIMDDGYLIAGDSYSNFSGDLWQSTDGWDFWLIKLNEDLNITWQYIIGGSGIEKSCSFDLNASGQIVIGGQSDSPISGDKTEGYIAVDDMDYWALKIAQEDCVPQQLYTDNDHDLFGVDDGVIYWDACVGNYYASLVATDCEDTNDLIYPGRPEICDGFDNDCSGIIDDGLADCLPGPAIEFQNTMGGFRDDYLQSLTVTSDGGYLFGGYSYSYDSGDKSEENWDNELNYADYWIVKTDAELNIEWENTIGGTRNDTLESVRQTPDGGYILGGTSSSPLSGDKTEPSLGPLTTSDYWVIKLNSTGSIEWQNTIGGSGSDNLMSVDLTADGGYILGGYSTSPNDFDKTEPSLGNADYWIIKLNASGNIIWQNTIGGSSYDYLQSIKQTTDLGYIVCGYSKSPLSGDKTEGNIIGTSANDYWIIKLDATGNIIWQNTIGSTDDDYAYDIIQTTDGGYLVGGHSESLAGFDKSENVIGGITSKPDCWIVKLNSSGNVVWENTIGGTGKDYFGELTETPEGNYFIGGYSDSQNTFDKTEVNFGFDDYWVFLLDNSGNIIWQNTIGGKKDDILKAVGYTADGGYIIGGYSISDLYYDKNESYIPDYYYLGYFDYWVVKLFPDCAAVSETCNALDDNCNGLIDDDVTETINISAGGATTFCQGGSTLLTASYSGASVQWKKNGSNIPGATTSTYLVNKSGNYSAVTTSPCGTATSSIITVTVNKNPNANISAGGATTFCAGGSVTLTEIPVAGCTYQWYKGASLIAGATTTNYIATTAGNYKCRVTKTATGCYKNSNAISVTVPCKEGELSGVNGEASFTIYPNPNSGAFEISVQNLASATSPFEGELRGMRVEIYNSIGQLIYSQQINSTDNNFSQTISLDHISSGIYFVRVGDGNNYAEQKLIVEN